MRRAAEALPEFMMQPPPAPAPRFDFGERGIAVNEPPKPSGVKLRMPDTHGGFPMDSIPADHSMVRIGELRPMGQLHNSFIIAAGADGLWIIDQHVAHERILFEQVLAQQAAGRVEMQQLLMPMILQLTPDQQIEYARIADELHASGFETEPFGNRTIAVKAAPAAVGLGDLERVILEILEIAEHELRSVSSADLRRGIAASIACRAAIKINTPLDQRQDGVDAAEPGGDGVSDGVSAWPARGAAIRHARNSASLSPNLIFRCGRNRRWFWLPPEARSFGLRALSTNNRRSSGEHWHQITRISSSGAAR